MALLEICVAFLQDFKYLSHSFPFLLVVSSGTRSDFNNDGYMTTLYDTINYVCNLQQLFVIATLALKGITIINICELAINVNFL